MHLRLLVVLAALPLAGCFLMGPQLDIYVGGPLSRAVADFGPPQENYRISGSVSAFVWHEREDWVEPARSEAETRIDEEEGTEHTTYKHTPPTYRSSRCRKVLLAEWVVPRPRHFNDWRVVGFQPEKCQRSARPAAAPFPYGNGYGYGGYGYGRMSYPGW